MSNHFDTTNTINQIIPIIRKYLREGIELLNIILITNYNNSNEFYEAKEDLLLKYQSELKSKSYELPILHILTLDKIDEQLSSLLLY